MNVAATAAAPDGFAVTDTDCGTMDKAAASLLAARTRDSAVEPPPTVDANNGGRRAGSSSSLLLLSCGFPARVPNGLPASSLGFTALPRSSRV